MRVLLARVGAQALDIFILTLAYWSAFVLRFENDIPQGVLKRAVILWPYVIGGQYSLLAVFGVRRFSWRHVGLWEVRRIVAASLLSTVVLLAVRLGAGFAEDSYLRYAQVPIGVIVINFILVFVGITGVRVVRRMMVERDKTRTNGAALTEGVRTLLVGAGQAGVLAAKEIASWPNLGIQPVGFVDDDPLKSGALIQGSRVLGGTDLMVEIAKEAKADQALITIAGLEPRLMRRITELCKQASLPTKIIPGMYEIVGGRVNLSRIRDVAIHDLLGRPPVVLEESSIDHVLRNRVVLVTGAAGSIGRELCLQVVKFRPKKLVVVDQNETGLFYTLREVRALLNDDSVVARIADVCNRERMNEVFAQTRPEAVFHAAAYKHVGMMEDNVREAIQNNVFGTRVVADLAKQWGSRQFVLISTDKAVNPSSVMGATKRLAEMYVQGLAQGSDSTLFVAVRFGNVLGSAGSVVPLFTEQIARGGPVTVTHPEMRRYFMTIEEASRLVLQAAGIGEGGEIFILDMGEPVKIVDLARDLITLSGLCVGNDIEIVFTGSRPGEKLFEELSVAVDKADRTRHSKIFIERILPPPYDELSDQMRHLARAAASVSEAELKGWLQRLVPEFTGAEASTAPVADSMPAARPAIALG